MLGAAAADAFTIGETSAALATQSALAGSSAQRAAPAIGAVRQKLRSSGGSAGGWQSGGGWSGQRGGGTKAWATGASATRSSGRSTWARAQGAAAKGWARGGTQSARR
jgi:hypothetical protein